MKIAALPIAAISATDAAPALEIITSAFAISSGILIKNEEQKYLISIAE